MIPPPPLHGLGLPKEAFAPTVSGVFSHLPYVGALYHVIPIWW